MRQIDKAIIRKVKLHLKNHENKIQPLKMEKIQASLNYILKNKAQFQNIKIENTIEDPNELWIHFKLDKNTRYIQTYCNWFDNHEKVDNITNFAQYIDFKNCSINFGFVIKRW